MRSVLKAHFLKMSLNITTQDLPQGTYQLLPRFLNEKPRFTSNIFLVFYRYDAVLLHRSPLKLQRGNIGSLLRKLNGTTHRAEKILLDPRWVWTFGAKHSSMRNIAIFNTPIIPIRPKSNNLYGWVFSGRNVARCRER